MTADIVKSKSEIILASLEEFKKGPIILRVNEERKTKAITVGNDILSKIQEGGMDDALDERANNFLANCSKANKEMKELRSPVTQIMDQLKKMYTEVENDLDPTKEGSIPNKIQKERNAYAEKKANEKKEIERQAALELAKKQELIDLKAEAKKQLAAYFNNHIAERKNTYLKSFNEFTLDDIEQRGKIMKNLTPSYNVAHYNAFELRLNSTNFGTDDFKEIRSEIMLASAEDFAQQYKEQIGSFLTDLIDKLPAKLAELQEAKRLADEAEKQRIQAEVDRKKREEEMAKADAKRKAELEEQARLQKIEDDKKQEELRKQKEQAEADRKKREEEEAAEIARKNEEEQKKAAEKVDIESQGEATMAMFEKEMQVADTNDAGPIREGYEIIIKHPVGYTQIFAFWFERAGKDLAIDKLGNTKLDQMKAWCEKLAFKTNEKITSQFIEYKETFKAVNKKAKAE